jgi:hypothetical protein
MSERPKGTRIFVPEAGGDWQGVPASPAHRQEILKSLRAAGPDEPDGSETFEAEVMDPRVYHWAVTREATRTYMLGHPPRILDRDGLPFPRVRGLLLDRITTDVVAARSDVKPWAERSREYGLRQVHNHELGLAGAAGQYRMVVAGLITLLPEHHLLIVYGPADVRDFTLPDPSAPPV